MKIQNNRKGSEENGVISHIPFSLGVELGPRHNVNIEFTYYFHNSVEQFVGAAAVGLSFPLIIEE